MKFSYDLHMHSALSPCADKDMTPNNIVNMAVLNGLDIIAVTDHNSAENVEAIIKVAETVGLTVIPAMEFEVAEEFHVVCLFPTLDGVLKLQELAYNSLPPLENKKEIFGEQLIINSEDEVVGECKLMLIAATSISVYELVGFVKENGGVAIPAHVDRESYSILISLGIIPDDLGFEWIEFSKNCDVENFCITNGFLDGFSRIKSSDAHYLADIFESGNYLELSDKKPTTVIELLKKKKCIDLSK